MNFIELFNEIVLLSKPMNVDFVEAKSFDDKMTEIGIDSMDSLIIGIYFCDLYGIGEDVGKEWHPTTIKELYDLLMENKTKEPLSIESAIAELK